MTSDERPTGEAIAARLAEIRAREQKAKPGPWSTDHESTISVYVMPLTGWYICEAPIPASEWHKPKATHQPRHDLEFIAHARTDIPWLLAQLDAALSRERTQEEQAKQLYRRLFDSHVSAKAEINQLTRANGDLAAQLQITETDLTEVRARERALKAALREAAVQPVLTLPGTYECTCCNTEWDYDGPERHAAGCLVKEDGESNG